MFILVSHPFFTAADARLLSIMLFQDVRSFTGKYFEQFSKY